MQIIMTLLQSRRHESGYIIPDMHLSTYSTLQQIPSGHMAGIHPGYRSLRFRAS